MRVLVVARGRGTRSGQRPAAPGWALDGELVRPPWPDAGTGASAGAWVGLVSGRAAEAARVVELDLQREGLVAAFADACFAIHGYDGAGDGAVGELAADERPCPDWVLELVDQHLDLALAHPVGTLVPLVDASAERAPLPLSA